MPYSTLPLYFVNIWYAQYFSWLCFSHVFDSENIILNIFCFVEVCWLMSFTPKYIILHKILLMKLIILNPNRGKRELILANCNTELL